MGKQNLFRQGGQKRQKCGGLFDCVGGGGGGCSCGRGVGWAQLAGEKATTRWNKSDAMSTLWTEPNQKGRPQNAKKGTTGPEGIQICVKGDY